MSESAPARAGNKVLNTKIFELRSQGLTLEEIADRLDVSYSTIRRAINSEDTKQMLSAAREKLTRLVDKAIDVYTRSLEADASDRTNAQKAARDVLKNFGLLRDSVDMNHNFPKPTVIKRSNGDEVILGAAMPDESENEREGDE